MKTGNINNARDRRASLPARSFVVGMISALVLAGLVGAAERAKTAAPDIVRLDRGATPTERAKYPSEMVVKSERAFDDSYTSAIEYRSEDRKVSIGLWQSEPGILQTDGYPHDEYCLVIEGHLIITNRSGRREEFDPGDAFVIPKGWAGTWNMTARFRKQYAAFEAAGS
jgi:uncharacterized cupin superfamily protein